METVECCLCHAETPLATSLVVTRWAFCQDCLREIWTRASEILWLGSPEPGIECSCCRKTTAAGRIIQIGAFRICDECVNAVAEELPAVLRERVERCGETTRETSAA